MWSKLGIGALLVSILLLGYNVLVAVMKMGHTDRFIFVPSSLINTLGTEKFLWVNDIRLAWIQQITLPIVKMPLSFLTFCIAMFCVFIHMVASKAS